MKGLLNISTAFLPFWRLFLQELVSGPDGNVELRVKAMVKTERFIKHFEGALGDP